MAPERPVGIAPKETQKYRDQVWAGLVDDPKVLAAERKRREAALLAQRTRELGEKQAAAMTRHDAGLMVDRD